MGSDERGTDAVVPHLPDRALFKSLRAGDSVRQPNKPDRITLLRHKTSEEKPARLYTALRINSAFFVTGLSRLKTGQV